MNKSKKYKMSMILSILLAAICFIGGAYIFISRFIETGGIDFTWTSNILIGLAGILIILANYFNTVSKESKSLFD